MGEVERSLGIVLTGPQMSQVIFWDPLSFLSLTIFIYKGKVDSAC